MTMVTLAGENGIDSPDIARWSEVGTNEMGFDNGEQEGGPT